MIHSTELGDFDARHVVLVCDHDKRRIYVTVRGDFYKRHLPHPDDLTAEDLAGVPLLVSFEMSYLELRHVCRGMKTKADREGYVAYLRGFFHGCVADEAAKRRAT